MSLFASIKKSILRKNQITFVAPISGHILPLEQVPDVVFADKIVGDGLAIDPTGSQIVAPVDGEIGKIFETNHAFIMVTDSGIELFVHFGIDTVELKGEGFKRIAKTGNRVQAGDVIVEIDLEKLKTIAKSVITPVVISNMDEVSIDQMFTGEVVQGQTPILTATVK